MSETDNEDHLVCPIGPPPWHYKCRDCGHEFDMPAPRGPSEERKRACPSCQGRNIQRLDTGKSEACPPGG